MDDNDADDDDDDNYDDDNVIIDWLVPIKRSWWCYPMPFCLWY